MKEQFENEMKLEFISKAANEAFARITVAAFASQLDPTIEELADIKTAVSEAVTNCIIHAYENRQGIIKINAKLPNLERSGMGFTIMESFMDTMKVESIVGLGTKITLTKKIKKEKEIQEEDSFEFITKE